MSAPNPVQVIYEALTETGCATQAIISGHAWCPQAPDGWLNKYPAIVYDVADIKTHNSQSGDMIVIVSFDCFSGNESFGDCRTLQEALRTVVHGRGKKYASGTFVFGAELSGNPGTFIDGPGKDTLWKVAQSEYRIRITA